jgi:hypothetical protein
LSGPPLCIQESLYHSGKSDGRYLFRRILTTLSGFIFFAPQMPCALCAMHHFAAFGYLKALPHYFFGFYFRHGPLSF